ncbi:MAG: FAD-dependent oxidoreductase [Cyanobacteria bacterium P01_H01_bin.21]
MVTYDTDYDLAILGGSVDSRFAACRAAQKGARVALIAPNWRASDRTYYVLQALRAWPLDSKTDWSSLRAWIRHRCNYPTFSSTTLSTQGVDVISEPASFTQGGRLQLDSRSLKASRYLLTDGYTLSSLTIDQGLFCGQLTQLAKIPKRIAVVGYGATVLEWAYALSHRATVTLIWRGASLLPAEDHDIRRLAEAQLKGLGIKLLSLSDCLEGKDSQLDAKMLDVDLLVVVPQPYKWEAMSLKAVGIVGEPIPVNCYLQTAHPKIYVSGGSLGGENRAELTCQETSIALENALFKRSRIMRYERSFYSIELLSPVGRWGLTEYQARQRYGQDIMVGQASSLPSMTDQVCQTNFCKLIVRGAHLVGVHLMGEGSPNLAATLGSRPRLHTLSRWAMATFESGTLAEAVYQAIANLQNQRWQPGQWRRDWAENWFNLRRSWDG